MDSLTHALWGLAVSQLRKPDTDPGESYRTSLRLRPDRPGWALRWTQGSPTDRAILWGTLLAAEAPDLDGLFYPRGEHPAVAYFRWHRSWGHSLLGSTILVLLISLLCRLIWRKARYREVLLWTWLGTMCGHLANDLFTGWGTQLLWPFNTFRFGLNWVAIVDLGVTLPPLLCTVYAYFVPGHRRRAVVTGFLLSLLYLGGRGAAQAYLAQRVRAAYAAVGAQRVVLSPTALPWRWTYTVQLPSGYAAGRVSLADRATPAPAVQHALPDPAAPAVAAALREPDVQVLWRFCQWPLVDVAPRPSGGWRINLADARYLGQGSLGGARFIIDLDAGYRLQAIAGGYGRPGR